MAYGSVRQSFDTDAIVIGAGAVGLACAATLSRHGLETLVLETTGLIGSGTSSRNSEVVHAGIYYPTGSLRHRMCVAGRRMLYPYMEARGRPALEGREADCRHQRRRNAQDRGPEVDRRRQRSRGLLADGRCGRPSRWRPNLRCTAALMSSQTGIMDSHGVMLAYQGELEDNGGAIVFKTPVDKVTTLPGGGFEVWTGGADPTRIRTPVLINSAGLYAHRVAANFDGYDPRFTPPFVIAKGNYYGCAASPPSNASSIRRRWTAASECTSRWI